MIYYLETSDNEHDTTAHTLNSGRFFNKRAILVDTLFNKTA